MGQARWFQKKKLAIIPIVLQPPPPELEMIQRVSKMLRRLINVTLNPVEMPSPDEGALFFRLATYNAVNYYITKRVIAFVAFMALPLNPNIQFYFDLIQVAGYGMSVLIQMPVVYDKQQSATVVLPMIPIVVSLGTFAGR